MGSVQTIGKNGPVDQLGRADSQPCYTDAQRSAHQADSHQAGGRFEAARLDHQQTSLARAHPARSTRPKRNLLGSLLVTGLKQAALSLSIHESDKQKPCALYLDEMNNFIEKETIEALTQETDKFQIGFVGCCKTLQHLPEDFRNQIIINVGTLLAFALAKKDGDMIGPQMFRVDGGKVKHRTIQNFFNQVNTSPQFELISDEEKAQYRQSRRSRTAHLLLLQGGNSRRHI